MERKQGISLIALIITIIVIVVLAVAVILSIANNNPIENARKAAFQNDMSALKEELNLYIQKKALETAGSYNKEKLNADSNTLIEEDEIKENKNIKDVLRSISNKYIEKVKISKGNLEYISDDLKELGWANEVFSGIKANYEEKKEENSSNIEIENAVEGKLENLKIYGNSIQNGTPAPDNPVEIESIGDKTKNLFDKSKVTLNDRLFNDGSTAKASTLGDGNKDLTSISFVSDYIPVENENSYSFNEISNNKFLNRVCLYDKNKNFVMCYEDIGKKIDISNDNAAYIRFTSEITKLDNIILEKGTFTTEYEPYGKYKIPITVTGKNLWNTDITYPVTSLGNELINYDSDTQVYTIDKAYNGISQSIYKLENPIPTGTKITVYMYILEGNIGGTITFGGYHVGDTNSWQGKINLGDYRNQDLSGKVLKETYVTTDTVTDFLAFLNFGYTINSPLKFKMMYKIGDDENDEFEPYKETTTNVYLDEPLRKIGDYVDYIDLKSKIIVRNTGKLNFNGSEAWTYENNQFRYIPKINWVRGIGLSNIYITSRNTDDAFFISGNNLQINIQDPTYSNLSEFKEMLSNRNMEVLFGIDKNTEEKITLQDISLFKGYNNIKIGTSVTPSNIETIYDKAQ